MKKIGVFLVVALVFFAALFVVATWFYWPVLKNNSVTIKIGSAVIKAELATTEPEQVQGLSGRTSLAANSGMLFVFNKSGYWGIWMKDMFFPIDVLWIKDNANGDVGNASDNGGANDNLKITDIVENMSPASYPKDYLPSVPVSYVLEIPAGTVKEDKIVVGQNVIIQ